MVDLASPEARERIARAMCCPKGCAAEAAGDGPHCSARVYMDDADAALSEVAAMLKEE